MSTSNPVLEPQPFGVAADRQCIADGLANLVMVVGRIADAIENQNRSMVQALPPEALSYPNAAKFLGVDLPAIKELVRTHKLPYIQYGTQRGRMILVKDLRNFLTKYRQPSGEEMLSRRQRA